ncbi:MAG: ATP synthase F1 subunit epsilon [Armatimonadetes bacterium]|nr:ATP synthase F1 subunit epsilon [Armatimonadota bacterium]NIM24076.1 ATP synthase F1 subunit epsilon [Armatimonadota bacterium]NIM67930.1 ATP synthase F1 subunit epsilon [Armatimonadota bacterium]NIM76452.1 ATP synthase F1 subunit epsilon [Armatimonadota bacterium]NIN06160.1 ATP synthase F1 subunit epsilon [Armatimonadota bacterium]
MREFSFEILSPERIIYQRKIVSLVAPGVEGYLGVMANHAPMLAALTVGQVKSTDASNASSYFALSGGILGVSKDQVTLLADAAEKAEEIDVGRAESAKSRALSRLSKRSPDVDIAKAHASLMRALNRLHVAAKRTGRG